MRDARRLAKLADNPRVTLIEGDVLDAEVLDHAVAGQDVVYANLAGDMERQARTIVTAMDKAGVRRLIFISSMGIYDEEPGEHHGSVLDPYRNSAKVVEASDLDYTIIRPAWLDDQDEIAYGTSRKGDSFVNSNATVSRMSVADLVVKLAMKHDMGLRESLGVHAA